MLFILSDKSLRLRLKNLIQQERQLLTQVLEHLHEVERRRLHSDFDRSSLFDYAVHEPILAFSRHMLCGKVCRRRCAPGNDDIGRSHDTCFARKIADVAALVAMTRLAILSATPLRQVIPDALIFEDI